MRGADEGDEHLNMKGAVCDLLNPQAAYLQGINPITQKQAIQTGNKTSSPDGLLLGDIQASFSNYRSLHQQGVEGSSDATVQRICVTQHIIHSFEMFSWREAC